MIQLFKQYPVLAQKLPYVSLGEFPTAVQKLDRLGKYLSFDNLFIKRDDLSGNIYGGNKVRKLEFILGNALRSRAKEVLTFGSAGSNFALATAIYTKKLGLNSISMLLPQPNAEYVRCNLLLSYHVRAEMHYYVTYFPIVPSASPAVFYQLLRHRLITGKFPVVIPVGGSSPLGVVGFVNAAYELEEQIRTGQIPQPDYIYVACGSMGTAAGLILGLKAINSKTQVIPVKVNSDRFVNVKGMISLIKKTNSLLTSLDSTFPAIAVSERDINLKHDYLGRGYGLFTREAVEVAGLMEYYCGIKLEGTYTGKTFTALYDDIKKSKLNKKIVLFWNTYNSIDYSEVIATIDYHQLPKSFHQYFEQGIQS